MDEWKDLPTICDVAEAVAAGMEIEVSSARIVSWKEWNGETWHSVLKYRARPRPRKSEIETFDGQLDAARYRWLRDKLPTLLITKLLGSDCITHTRADLDAAIDEAIGAAKQPAKVQVKSLCWRSKKGGSLFWWDESVSGAVLDLFCRFPAGDIPGEVEA